MYPKSFSEVDSVVLPSKDTSFMDRMYMKLEAICVEADRNPSLLFQEASKYVESQVTTAGANMRKICSELIRDLLPPPDELSEGEERKCQCRRETEEKKAKQVKNSTMQQLGSGCAGVKVELCEAQCNSKENIQEVDHAMNASSAGDDSGSVAQAAERIEAESDTEVEAGDQKAQWYVSDEYRRISGIGVPENLGGDAMQQVTSSKDELEADWELL